MFYHRFAISVHQISLLSKDGKKTKYPKDLTLIATVLNRMEYERLDCCSTTSLSFNIKLYPILNYIISYNCNIVCPLKTRIDQAPSTQTDIVYAVVDDTRRDIGKSFYGKAIFIIKDLTECPSSSIDYGCLLPKCSIAKYKRNRNISVPFEFMELISVSHYGHVGIKHLQRLSIWINQMHGR